MGTAAFLGGVRGWIERLALRVEDAAKLVDVDAAQLDRLLNFPELTPMLRQVLHVLDGLGLGIVGVERLTTAMVVRRLDQCREARKMTKSELASRAGVNRAHLTSLFQHTDPDPKLETVLKLAAALECDLTIEQRRELPRSIALSSEASSSNSTTSAPAPAPAVVPPVDGASRPLAPASDEAPDRAPPSSLPTVVGVSHETEYPPTQPSSAKLASASPTASSTISIPAQAVNPPPSRSSPPPASATSASARPPAATPESASTPQTSAAARPTRATSHPTGAASHPTAPNGATSGARAASSGSAPTSARPSNAANPAPGTSSVPTSPRASSDVRPPPASATPSAGLAPTNAQRSGASPPAPATASPPSSPRTTPGAQPPPANAAPSSAKAPASPPRVAESAAPRPSPAPTPSPNTTAKSPHLDPALNPALAHVLERIAQARTRAELDALNALHQLEVQRLQYQHERQLAARIAAERAAAEAEARTNNMVFGGTAVAAAVASTTALALQTPENRQTAQAVLGLGGGALAIAGALSQSGSTARNVCLGLGITAVGIAAADFLSQLFSEPPGAIGVTVRAGHGALVIQSVAPQSAAASAGLIGGDEILHVDGVPVAQLGANEATRRLRGEVGSQVRVRIRRHWNGGLEWDATLVRAAR